MILELRSIVDGMSTMKMLRDSGSQTESVGCFGGQGDQLGGGDESRGSVVDSAVDQPSTQKRITRTSVSDQPVPVPNSRIVFVGDTHVRGSPVFF